MKICSNQDCPFKGEPQDESVFGPNKSNKDGLQNWCKVCRRRYYNDNKDRIAQLRKLRYDKEKNSKRCKDYRERKGEELKEKKKLYYLETRDEKLYYQKQYYLDNKDDILEYQNQYEKEKKLSDSCFRMQKRVTCAVYSAIKRRIRGCIPRLYRSCILIHFSFTIEILMKHLESLWKPWMNWDNYGVYKINGPRRWNIDHIIAQSVLPFDTFEHPNFLKCWSLENLRPLDAIKNMNKGKK